MAHNQLLMNHK